MRRLDRLLDAAIVAAGVVAAAAGMLLARSGEGAFNTLFIVVAVVLGGVTLNHTIHRGPELVVGYRNPDAGDRPVVWQNANGQPHARLRVVVQNHGRGDAEAVEVRFAKLGVMVWNETGNLTRDVDDTVSPPRFSGGTRVLTPGESWTIAMLSDAFNVGWQPGPAPWSARAKHMTEQHGTVEVELLTGPPSSTG